MEFRLVGSNTVDKNGIDWSLRYITNLLRLVISILKASSVLLDIEHYYMT